MERKNKIVAIVVVTLSLVMIAGLFFLLFGSLKTIISEFETMPELTFKENATTEETEMNFEETVPVGDSSGSPSEDPGEFDTVTITVQIYKVSCEDYGHPRELYSENHYSVKKNSNYTISLPDYSEQNYYPDSPLTLTGVGEKDVTHKIFYYPVSSTLYFNTVDGVSTITIDKTNPKNSSKELCPIILKNNTQNAITSFKLKAYVVGQRLEKIYYETTGYNSDFYIPAGGSIVVFPYTGYVHAYKKDDTKNFSYFNNSFYRDYLVLTSNENIDF